MQKNNPTRKEHYIPQVYLRGFTSNDQRIYFYDLKTRRYSNKMVPVKSICFKKDLYEYKNNENNTIYTNNIEKALSTLEKMFAKQRDAIRSRIKIANSHTTSFLSDEEGAFWITYIAIQIFRMPKVIDEITLALKEMLPSNEEANFHRNTALYILLPFLKQLNPESIELKLYNELFTSINSMQCTIAYDEQHRLFTSDCVLYMYSPSQKISDCRKIVFPIDSSLCLLFTKEEPYPDNGIIIIDDNEYERLCKSIAYSADEKLYLPRKLTPNELCWIKSARNDREIDQKRSTDLPSASKSFFSEATL